MISGSSNMVGGALRTAFSLLLLAYITQGLQDVELFHYETLEAEVGQNITLPCIVRDRTDLKIVNTEWSKRENEKKKLAVYTPTFGTYLFRPNVTIEVVNNDANKFIGSNLQLHEVERGNSGIYICEVATFPFGSIRTETKLKIRDVIRIVCNVDSSVEVYSGANVTIHCTVLPNAQYRWTKNKEMLSQNESLELWWVTDAHAGVYTLTVNTGNKTLHKEFNITILATTTSSRGDLVTVSPRFNVTEEGLKKSANSSLSTELSTTDTSVTWTMGVGTSVVDNNPKPSNVTITASFTINSVTSSPAANTDPYNFHNSTTISYDSTVLAVVTTSNDMRSEESSTLGNRMVNSANPGATPTLSAGNTMDATGAKDIVRSRLCLVFIIVPILVLIAVAGILHRRQLIKQRMDGPPPFKPPPPPAKYTSARHQDIYRPFPTSRCNSVTELNMKNLFIDI